MLFISLVVVIPTGATPSRSEGVAEWRDLLFARYVVPRSPKQDRPETQKAQPVGYAFSSISRLYNSIISHRYR